MNRAEWPEGYGATGGHGFWHLEGYYRPWSVGSDTERHDITTDEPGALSFAAMMADRDGLRAELAKVTAERDAGRERLLCACTYVDLERNGNERDMARLLAVPRYELPALLSDALNVNWICRERATPTEGD